MASYHGEKYWETEKGETIEFGSHFMTCFDKAGKLQFGNTYTDSASGERRHRVMFTLDRKELFSNDEAPDYLRGVISDWREMLESGRHDD